MAHQKWMLLKYCLPLHFTTTHCLSLPLQPVSDNGTSKVNVIEILLSSSSSPLHYHTLSISTTAGSKWQWHINSECLNYFCLHLPLHFTTTHCLSLPLQRVSDNGTSKVNVIEILSSSPLHYHTLSVSTTAASKWQWHVKSECYWNTFVFIFISTSLPHIVHLYHCSW